MIALKKRWMHLPFLVLIVAGLLFPVTAVAGEKIGKVVAVKGSVKVYRVESRTLDDLKMSDDIAQGDMMVTGSGSGVQIAVAHHTAVSAGPDSLFIINKQISRKKKESHHITLLRGRVRTTSYSKILPENPNKALHIDSPYGSFSFDGADLVVGVNDVVVSAQGNSDILLPCPSGVTKNDIEKLSGILEDGRLPKKRLVVMQACPENKENDKVEFVGFQQPKIKKKMISKSGIALIDAWVIAGEVGYTPPSKKRPVLTLESGEGISFDGEGKVVAKGSAR